MQTNEVLSKIVFWNIWGHRCPDDVHEHLQEHPDTDIFCMTEALHGRNATHGFQLYTNSQPHTSREPPVNIDGLDRLRRDFGEAYNILYVAPTYRIWECTKTRNKFSDVGFGSALMYQKSVEVIETGHEISGLTGSYEIARVLQWIVYRKAGEKYLVAHLHGLWLEGNSKGDDPRRMEQSKEVLHHLTRLSKKFKVSKIVFGGDLNLAMDTMALQLLETGHGDSIKLRNHIREFGIKNTRTPWYRRYDDPAASKHADYVLSSASVSMVSVKADTACMGSDHAPLHATFC